MMSDLLTPLLLPLMVATPLIAALVSILVGSKRLRVGISLLFAILQVLIALGLVLFLSTYQSAIRYELGGWGAPLGIDLTVDGLSALMLMLSSVLVLVLSLYSSQYFSHQDSVRFWPLWWLLIAGLNAVFLAADAFNIFVALEIMGLSAVALVSLGGSRAALMSALRYALVGLLGSLLYLLGVALLYRAYGTLDLLMLSTVADHNPLTWVSLSLISLGLLLKTALLPLHFWLPAAHSSAPAPVSAVLSALVVKASFYLLMRFWFDVLSPATNEIGMTALGVLGAVAIIWGCVAALRAQRLKLLIAYSTVAQIGYLFLLFPLATASGSSMINAGTIAAVVYFILAHALAKAAMFLAAGDIQSYYGHDNINKLKGLVLTLPMAVATFAIAGVSLIGLPPSGGFIAKWLLLESAISSGKWWWAVIMLMGGLLAALYIGKVLSIAFNQDIDRPTVHRPAQNRSAFYGFTLAILAVFCGFNTEWVLNLLEVQFERPLMTSGGVQ